MQPDGLREGESELAKRKAESPTTSSGWKKYGAGKLQAGATTSEGNKGSTGIDGMTVANCLDT